MKKPCLKGVWLCLAAFTADRVTKRMVLRTLQSGTAQVLPGLLSFELCKNSGVAFGLFAETPWLSLCFSLALIIALAALQLWGRFDGLSRSGLWLMLGGATGNLFDRLRYGRDSIFENHLFQTQHSLPTFYGIRGQFTAGATGTNLVITVGLAVFPVQAIMTAVGGPDVEVGHGQS